MHSCWDQCLAGLVGGLLLMFLLHVHHSIKGCAVGLAWHVGTVAGMAAALRLLCCPANWAGLLEAGLCVCACRRLGGDLLWFGLDRGLTWRNTIQHTDKHKHC